MANAVQKNNAVQTRNNSAPRMTVMDLVKSQEKQIALSLPKYLSSEQFMRGIMTHLRMNPGLQECDAISLLGAYIQSAELGLQVSGALGEAYIVPYGETATFQPGYLGLVKLVRNSGQVRDFTFEVVYENDEFNYQLGQNKKLHHIPSEAEPGSWTHVYACAKLRGGGKEFKVMSKAQVIAHRDKYARKPKNPRKPWIWETNEEAMALKTVIRKLCKVLPKDANVNLALHLADTGESSDGQGMHLLALERGITPPAGWTEPTTASEDATTIANALANPGPKDNEPVKTAKDKVNDEAEMDAELKERSKAENEYADACGFVAQRGGSVEEILRVKDAQDVYARPLSQVQAATEILLDWIKGKEENGKK